MPNHDEHAEWRSLQRTLYEETAKAALGTATEMIKWLLATLLALNSGAIIAIINSDRIPISLVKTSCLFFIVGLLLAMVSGYLFLANSHEARQHSLRVIAAMYDPDRNMAGEELAQSGNPSKRLAKWAFVVGYTSFGTFIAGLVFIAAKLTTV